MTVQTFAKRLAPGRTWAFARQLRDCRSGLALTEFAFALPILTFVACYGFETVNLALTHSRVSNIGMLVSDNASRVRESIDEANVVEIMAGGRLTGASFDFSRNGRIILSSFEANSANTRQWIRWQRCSGALNLQSQYGQPLTASGTAITNATEILASNRSSASSAPSSPNMATLTAVGPTGNQISAQPGTAVMVVEVVYDYQPLFPGFAFGPQQIRYSSAFNVRQRTDQVLRNANAITPARCDQFTA